MTNSELKTNLLFILASALHFADTDTNFRQTKLDQVSIVSPDRLNALIKVQ